ncbi:hypothetical protein Pfo_023249 [Paulownia fortunei]|nr:hypothetical protein Pfo_023249 [Paulownia fortunei]
MVRNKAPTVVVCSVISNKSLTSTDHPTRRSDILGLMDQTDEALFRTGKFGRFGGIFVPETLVISLNKLVAEFHLILHDPEFQAELAVALRDYVGREAPLYFAKGQGPDIYLKREDLNHTGAHKINNAIAQVMLAKRMGRKNVVAATGAGQHGVATAAACAKLSLDCTIFMGNVDIERYFGSIPDLGRRPRQQLLLGWHSSRAPPCPSMVREFQSVIGKETRKQALEKWGDKPDVIVACVGSGSNAMGIFHEFVRDEDVRLIGVEAGGTGIDSGKHSATLAKGEVGVYHGAMSYLLQDDEGQIIEPHSIACRLEYPGVSPELSFLKDIGRAEFCTVTDEEALDAYSLLCRMEGIVPALEAARALSYLERLCPTLPSGSKVVINCSGRGDKDVATVFQYQQEQMAKRPS